MRLILVALLICFRSFAADNTWSFIVSGDSRNCGDVVMPEIAQAALQKQAAFYWHLGDFRAIYDFDQDYKQQYASKPGGPPMTIISYLNGAWNDFIRNQLEPFGNTPVFLGLGNHEVIPPKTREQLITQFADWLNAPEIRIQRMKDDPRDHMVRTYYHWVRDGIDFINMDNASAEQFDNAQMAWIKAILKRDEADPSIRALIVGMHEALPDSISEDHSMAASPEGIVSGRKLYHWLLDLKQRSGKPVYVLASHSHFYMDGTFNTEYWRNNGGVLPGWIIGTAGAVRYALPATAGDANAAQTNVYGYMEARISHDPLNPVKFTFYELKESDVLPEVIDKFTQPFVHDCWTGNSQAPLTSPH